MDEVGCHAALSTALADTQASGAQLRARLAEVVRWYQDLSLTTLDDIDRYYAQEALFRDPFNSVRSREGIRHIFQHMFSSLQAPEFFIHEWLLDGQQAFLTWTFSFVWRGRALQVQGGSHLHFNPQFEIAVHRDYWDSAEELLQKLPWVGRPLRYLRRLLSVRDEGFKQFS